jgi:hypothetical protein
MSHLDLLDRINDYLVKGGLFNPENMDHEKVQQLLLDIRDYLNWGHLKQPVLPTQQITYKCPVCGVTGINGYVCYNTACSYRVTVT